MPASRLNQSVACHEPAALRMLNVVFAGVGLAAFVLLLLLPIALLMKWRMPGPILYSQARVGRLNQTFTIYKLRTMTLDAERDGPRWATAEDCRVLPLGRWLRKTRLDEWPQLWNVLRGDMNIVGPRPERPEFVSDLERQIPLYSARHAVRPGITGLARVELGYANSFEHALRKLSYDLVYVRTRSIWLDAVILLRTVPIVFRLQGI